MNRQLPILRNLLITVAMLAVSLLSNSPVWAQTAPKATAELAAASRTTINGTSAISGMTIFNNNRVKTGQQGNAIVNAGKVGRMELGSDTELTLRFSPKSFGGDLHSGRTVVSVPAGVTVSVATAKGVVITDGTKATSLTIEVDSKGARVICHKGEARIVSGDKVERVVEGEEIAQGQRGDKWQHRRAAAAGAIAAATASQVGQIVRPAATAAATSQASSTLTSLVSMGISYSAVLLVAKDRNPEQLFDTSITCKDNESFNCQRRSGITP